MANINEVSKVFNTPNYSGVLYTATPAETPLLNLIGGVGGARARKTTSSEFATGVLYDLDEGKQPDISEDASLTAPTPTTVIRTQETNVTQIHQKTISVSYAKLANAGLMSGINVAGQTNNVNNEVDWQVAKALEQIAKNIEYSFINGTYNKATASNVANKTRGMINAVGTEVDASNGELTYNIVLETMSKAWKAGASFTDFYFFVNGLQKTKLTKIFNELRGFVLPATRNQGGVNITSFETDFGVANIVLSRVMPENAILGVDVAYVLPVEQDTPGKGNFFVEDLGKTGAGETKQIFGMIGLDHGARFKHLLIKNLSTTF